MILDIIKKTLSEYDLLNRGDTVLVGLSGGADSVCLTHALWSLQDEMGIKLYTAHINHGIRGEEAKRDENFAKQFSDFLGIHCYISNVKVRDIAKLTGISEEMAGRKIRYEFFIELCKKHGINKIATAHNKNDNAETLLLNFMRGSSIKGLSGIPYKRENIIRPVLDLSRNEIEQYCGDNNLDYVTDSTNLSDDYTRNKIRHSLIPLIQNDFNSNFINTVTDNAVILKDDSKYLDEMASEFYNSKALGGTVLLTDLLSVDVSIRRRVIRYMLKEIYQDLNDIPLIYVSDILKLIKNSSGKRINLLGKVIAKNEYGKLIIEIEKDFAKPFLCKVDIGETKRIDSLNKTVSASEVIKKENDGSIYLSANTTDKIVIRSRKAGDRFSPVGMEGSKKLKEYFIDKKIPKDRRDAIPVIEINGEIAAVDDRVDKRFIFHDFGIKIEFKDI